MPCQTPCGSFSLDHLKVMLLLLILAKESKVETILMNLLHLIRVMQWTVGTILPISLKCLPNPALLPLHPLLSVLPQAEGKGVPPGYRLGAEGARRTALKKNNSSGDDDSKQNCFVYVDVGYQET